MAVIYLIMMAIPVVLSTFVWLLLRRWTRLKPLIRWAIATLFAPGLLVFLYGQLTSTVDADERAAFVLAMAVYLGVAGGVFGLLEWRQQSRK
jgi:uncharacterized membrane protein YeiH